MPCVKYNLPEYPCKSDMWDVLSKEERPIVVYGMGNGADKLVERFEKYNIKISDFFASDGFVRGHFFRGFRVKSFSEIKESYSDFVIVLSFASNREEVITMLSDIDERYDMYVPDMPVADTSEYFDREFFNAHYNEICEAYNRFCDEESKNTFAAIINYKLSGRMKYLMNAYSSLMEMYSLLPVEEILVSVDAGAYNGDTVREAIRYFPNLRQMFAIEPDRRNFKKLVKYSEAEDKINVCSINAAAWCENSVGAFSDSGNRNSTISATASFEHKETEVSLIKIDSIEAEKIDYIKYDVEGAEREALKGSEEVILRDRPAMLVSLYHRSRDIFAITNELSQKYPFYKLYLRRLKCLPAWEINLLLINDEGK